MSPNFTWSGGNMVVTLMILDPHLMPYFLLQANLSSTSAALYPYCPANIKSKDSLHNLTVVAQVPHFQINTNYSGVPSNIIYLIPLY